MAEIHGAYILTTGSKWDDPTSKYLITCLGFVCLVRFLRIRSHGIHHHLGEDFSLVPNILRYFKQIQDKKMRTFSFQPT